MSTRLAAVQALQDLAGAVTGIKGAPDYPEQDVILYPYLLAYYSAGDVTPENNSNETITLDLHAGAPDNFTIGIKTGEGYLDALIDAILAAPTLSDTVGAVLEISYTLGTLSPWKSIGYRLQLKVLRFD